MKKIQLAISVALFLSCLLNSPFAQAKTEVTVWTYYDFPPFITSKADKKGLSYDFVSLLNLHEEFNYHFKVKYVPRKRLDRLLNSGDTGIVLWVSPIFFADATQQKYLWTPSLLSDQQEFVSLKNNPVTYDGTPESLQGYIIGGVMGHRYKGIEEQMRSGLLIRKDVIRERQNIGKLLANRIDVFLIPNTLMAYYSKEMKLESKIFYSPTPLSRYSRHVMVPKNLPHVYKALNTIVKGLNQNGYWKALGEQYGLSKNLIQ